MEDNVILFVNGKKYVVPPEIDGETSLVTFLRNHVGLKGTKYMCREGACGACVVNYTTRHPVTGKEKSFAVNSCLLPVLSCNGAFITTVEGIGNKVKGYNKVQMVLAKFNGTQCGFCSPGMVMNMYSLLSSEHGVTMKDVEHSFAGNVCRCTGYRSILDAFKSLCSDASDELKEKTEDIEDLWKVCPNELQNCGNRCTSKCSKLKLPLKRINSKSMWLVPGSIEDIKEMLRSHDSYRVVAGNTGEGVYRSTTSTSVYININHVPELKSYNISPKQLELGASMTLSDAILLFDNLKKKKNFGYLKVFAEHILLVANIPVRNTGTLGGNLMIKYYHPDFISDLFLIFETVKATVVTVSEEGESGPITLHELYSKDMHKSVITKIVLPAVSDEFIMKTYKIMPRAQNAFALVNAGFLFRFDEDFNVIEKPHIVYGGINSNFIYSSKTGDYFTGKNIFKAFKTGILSLSEELDPTGSTEASPVFKKQLALNLFYKYVLNLKSDGIKPFYQSGGVSLNSPLSQGIQEYETKSNNWPLTKPINKLEALLQCSGEAVYVNDIPELSGQLYGALVLAEKAGATIKSIDSSTVLAMDGVVAFFTAKDIPGQNVFTPKTAIAREKAFSEIKSTTDFAASHIDSTFHITPVEEELFCSGKVLYGGQPVGIIIAETEEMANKAAKFVKIDYMESQQKQFFLTVKDVLKTEEKSRIKLFAEYKPKRNINLDKGKHKVEGEVEMGPQYHFTMEPQSCVCSPIEDGINIYSSTQWMSCIQGAVSKVLNISENSINMEVKRLGGGFGSKITRASLVATACALAAYKLNRPVKVILDIETNMKAIGKRNASYTKYEAGFDDTGYIEWLKFWHYNDGGCSDNDPAVQIVQPGIINCYDDSGFEINLFTVNTTTPSSSWMRAPGTIEGMTAIEEVIEHISFVLKKDPLEVRKTNLGKNFNFVDRIISTIINTSNYSKRKKEVETFNTLNRWKKKGISLVPMSFDLCYIFSHSSMVSIYGHDGTVSLTHGGIEMGQGINTKAVQVCATMLGIDESKIKVKSSTVLTSPNAHMTGASITSDNVAYSTMKCCEILNKRLEPIKKQMENATWEEIIEKAYSNNINLNASYVNKCQDGEIGNYSIYGAAVTEVELDVLTGQYQIVRADILEDAGESINPEIDIGQVEGGFVMGLGYLLTENIVFDPKTGLTLTNSTSNYWVPGPKDIPIDFRVTLLKNAPNPYGVLRSKATGEPPICLALSAVHALRNAIMSARNDCEEKGWLPYSQPFSVEKVCQATKTTLEHFFLT